MQDLCIRLDGSALAILSLLLLLCTSYSLLWQPIIQNLYITNFIEIDDKSSSFPHHCNLNKITHHNQWLFCFLFSFFSTTGSHIGPCESFNFYLFTYILCYVTACLCNVLRKPRESLFFATTWQNDNKQRMSLDFNVECSEHWEHIACLCTCMQCVQRRRRERVRENPVWIVLSVMTRGHAIYCYLCF